MNGNRVATWGIAALLACASAGAWAGSTGPTNPEGNGPEVPAVDMNRSQERNNDGTSPETRGMVPDPAQTNGMRNGHDDPHDANNSDNDSSTPNDEKPRGH
ncbi:hypothetical protein [Pseudomonas sp. NPDC089734]|uniref:hypothetical protein n=1 Tax=Pseudomonas sp. NPDC089734 TaxID=3364469 RepID=UPI00381122FD